MSTETKKNRCPREYQVHELGTKRYSHRQESVLVACIYQRTSMNRKSLGTFASLTTVPTGASPWLKGCPAAFEQTAVDACLSRRELSHAQHARGVRHRRPTKLEHTQLGSDPTAQRARTPLRAEMVKFSTCMSIYMCQLTNQACSQTIRTSILFCKKLFKKQQLLYASGENAPEDC